MPSETEFPTEVEIELRKISVALTRETTAFLDEHDEEVEEEIRDTIMVGLRQGALIMDAHWRNKIERLSENLKGVAADTKKFLL